MYLICFTPNTNYILNKSQSQGSTELCPIARDTGAGKPGAFCLKQGGSDAKQKANSNR
jgi:hypothetical protein